MRNAEPLTISDCERKEDGAGTRWRGRSDNGMAYNSADPARASSRRPAPARQGPQEKSQRSHQPAKARSKSYQRIGSPVLLGPHIENPRPSNRAPPHLQAAGPCQSRLPRLATPSRSRTLRIKTRQTESPGTLVIADGLWDPAVRCAGSMVRPPMLRDSEEPFRTLAV
jgi:hypothetical protein